MYITCAKTYCDVTAKLQVGRINISTIHYRWHRNHTTVCTETHMQESTCANKHTHAHIQRWKISKSTLFFKWLWLEMNIFKTSKWGDQQDIRNANHYRLFFFTLSSGMALNIQQKWMLHSTYCVSHINNWYLLQLFSPLETKKWAQQIHLYYPSKRTDTAHADTVV